MSAGFLRTALFTAVLIAAVSPVAAQEPAPPRYQLKSMGEGVVRLDTVTGDMLFCHGGDQAACAPFGDAAKPSASEVEALKTRIDALERKLDAASAKAGLPNDEEVDHGLSIMEKFMRRFMGLAREFDSENPPNGALPQKT